MKPIYLDNDAVEIFVKLSVESDLQAVAHFGRKNVAIGGLVERPRKQDDGHLKHVIT